MSAREETGWPRFTLVVPLILLGLVVFRFILPFLKGALPECLFFRASGLYCPGCGGTRSAEALVHFQLGEAIRQHAWFVGVVFIGLPVLFWMALKERNPELRGPRYRDGWLWFCLISLLVYAVLRNVPAMSWMAPN
ncbi:MAG: DUF2752 domain-containing protein [Akkermansiaceae bacterium]